MVADSSNAEQQTTTKPPPLSSLLRFSKFSRNWSSLRLLTINGDGVVSLDELATLLAHQQEVEPLLNYCPVCAEVLEVSDKLNTMIHLTLCFDEGTGNQIMTGGFLIEKEAAYGSDLLKDMAN